jgi:hypothetical protein
MDKDFKDAFLGNFFYANHHSLPLTEERMLEAYEKIKPKIPLLKEIILCDEDVLPYKFTQVTIDYDIYILMTEETYLQEVSPLIKRREFEAGLLGVYKSIPIIRDNTKAKFLWKLAKETDNAKKIS